jgi:leucyl-tRNA synthetase
MRLNEITVMVSINGKVRSELEIKTDEINNKEAILKLAKRDEKVIRWIGDKKIAKEIYVVGKMINFVILN